MRVSKPFQEIGRPASRWGVGRHLVKVFVVLPLALLALLVVATAAWAHSGSASISCQAVTFSFSGFPSQPGNTVQETVTIDNVQVASQDFTFNGASGSNTIAISEGADSFTVLAEANWNTNGVSGSFQSTQDLSGCSSLATTTTVATSTTTTTSTTVAPTPITGSSQSPPTSSATATTAGSLAFTGLGTGTMWIVLAGTLLVVSGLGVLALVEAVRRLRDQSST